MQTEATFQTASGSRPLWQKVRPKFSQFRRGIKKKCIRYSDAHFRIFDFTLLILFTYKFKSYLNLITEDVLSGSGRIVETNQKNCVADLLQFLTFDLNDYLS